MGPEIWKPNHLNPPFFKNHLKSRQKCPDFEQSGFQMVGAIAKAGSFEIRPSQSPNFCFRISHGQISDPHISPIIQWSVI